VLLDALIFQPDSYVPGPPPEVQERWITTKDKVRLHAWYAARRGARPTLVWSHGNGGNIAGRADVLLALAARGLNVLAYDYRGYGRSAGRPYEAGVYLDAQAAYDSERRRGVPATRIICFGESLGGVVSIHLASARPCAGVVVISTFTSMSDVARHHFGPLSFLVGKQFDALPRLRDLAVPIFIAHGDRDEIVPFELGERLFAAANQPKRFFRAAGAHHNDVFASPGLIDAIAEFAHAATAVVSSGR
jgi:fermentation-respiration switch protein FrsA (DUF1100 family)